MKYTAIVTETRTYEVAVQEPTLLRAEKSAINWAKQAPSSYETRDFQVEIKEEKV